MLQTYIVATPNLPPVPFLLPVVLAPCAAGSVHGLARLCHVCLLSGHPSSTTHHTETQVLDHSDSLEEGTLGNGFHVTKRLYEARFDALYNPPLTQAVPEGVVMRLRWCWN